MAVSKKGVWTVASIFLLLTVPALGSNESPRNPVELPSGIKPLQQAVKLRYRGFGEFIYTWRMDMGAIGKHRALLEGWIMQGTMSPQGDLLKWSYRLSNIGHDGIARERGTLHVLTDDWGHVHEAHVIKDRWANRSGSWGKIAADALFDEGNLLFPLCCCPRGPIHMGDVIPVPVAAHTMPVSSSEASHVSPPPGTTNFTYVMRSIAVGVVKQGSRRYLVVQHSGKASATGPEGSLQSQASGYTLIDTKTCLPRRGIWRHEFDAAPSTGAENVTVTHSEGSEWCVA